MKLYNDTGRFDGIFQLKDIDDSQEYGYSEVLQKIYNDLYVNGGAFKGEKGDPGTPSTNGKDGVSVSIVNNKYDNPLDDSVITTPAHSASLNIITEGSDQYFVILTNNTDTATETTWENVKASAVKISGDRGSDGFDGLSGADSVVPGPPGKDAKDGISWTTTALQFDTPDNQIVVQPYTTVIVFIKSTSSVATYTNATDAAITTNTNIFVYLSLKGDKGDSIKGDIGPQGNPSDVMNRAYKSAGFNEVITVTPKTILLLTAKYTDTIGPRTQFGVYVNNSESPVDVTANLSNTEFNWNDLQGSKGADSTVPGPKGDPGESIKGDKGDPGQITDTVVLNLTNPNSSDTLNINAYTLAFVFAITNSDKTLAIYNNNTSQTQTPTVGSLQFTSVMGKQGIQGIPGTPGKDSTVPGPASKIVTAFLNNPTADSTVATAGNTTTIVYVTTTSASGMVLSKMGSITNNSSNYISTKYSDINLTQVSSDQVIPEPGKNANVKTISFDDLDTSKTFTAPARTAYIITNKITSTGAIYIGTISNDTDSPADLSYSNVTFNKISADRGKDGKDGSNVYFIKGDSTASINVPAMSKIQMFDSDKGVIAVFINDTTAEVSKTANFTYESKGGGGSGSTKSQIVFDSDFRNLIFTDDVNLGDEVSNTIIPQGIYSPIINKPNNFRYDPDPSRMPYTSKGALLNSFKFVNNNSTIVKVGDTVLDSFRQGAIQKASVDGRLIQVSTGDIKTDFLGSNDKPLNMQGNKGESFIMYHRYALSYPWSGGRFQGGNFHTSSYDGAEAKFDDLLTPSKLKDFINTVGPIPESSNGEYDSEWSKFLTDGDGPIHANMPIVIANGFPITIKFDKGTEGPVQDPYNKVRFVVIVKVDDLNYKFNFYRMDKGTDSFTMDSDLSGHDELLLSIPASFSKPVIFDDGNYTETNYSDENTRVYLNSLSINHAWNVDSVNNYMFGLVSQTSTGVQQNFFYGFRKYNDLVSASPMAGVHLIGPTPDLNGFSSVDYAMSLKYYNDTYSKLLQEQPDLIHTGHWIFNRDFPFAKIGNSIGNPYMMQQILKVYDLR